jgi:hypothetical protein
MLERMSHNDQDPINVDIPADMFEPAPEYDVDTMLVQEESEEISIASA